MLSKIFNFLVLLKIFLNLNLNAVFSEQLLDDYKTHPCNRNCKTSKPMECNYDFKLEWYSVLNRNCFNCTNNPEDCFKPHCVSANGFMRPIKTVNRILPGPSIQVCNGDKIVVNVENSLHSFEGTSIHWHGLKQKGTPHMDGVSTITQCAISPHSTFQYSFDAVDPGTHLWHAHSAGQRADGLFGAIVIRDPNDTNSKAYDEDLPEHVIVVNDWMKNIMIAKYTAFLHTFGDEAIDGILINGRGVDVNQDKFMNKPRLEYETPRSTFKVTQGKRYRFRMINSGVQYCPLHVSIDNHTLTLIATDGNPIQPKDVGSFYIIPGERLDFVVTANKKIGNYWIRIKGMADCEETSIFQTAILKYETSSDQLPEIEVNYENADPLDPNGLIFNPFNQKISNENKDQFLGVDDVRSSVTDFFTSSYTKKISGKVDKQFFLALDMNIVKNSEVYDDSTWNDLKNDKDPWSSPQINNITFHMPYTPLIYQKSKIEKDMICNQDNRQNCSKNGSQFCRCIHMLNVNLNDLVEVIVVDGGSQEENHPIHLHGQSFAVLGVDKLGDTVLIDDIKLMDKIGTLKRNLVNPPIKDTVTIPSGGYTIFRFYAENPGVWFMHCHVEFHSEAGMSLVFKVGSDSDLPPEPIDWPQCGNYVNKEKNTINNGIRNTISNIDVLYLTLFMLLIIFKI